VNSLGEKPVTMETSDYKLLSMHAVFICFPIHLGIYIETVYFDIKIFVCKYTCNEREIIKTFKFFFLVKSQNMLSASTSLW
jgi:hypothetical protein